MIFKEIELIKIMNELMNIKDRFDSFSRKYTTDVYELIKNPEYLQYAKVILEGLKNPKPLDQQYIKQLPNNFDLSAFDFDIESFQSDMEIFEKLFENLDIINIANCGADYLFVLEQLIVRLDTQIDILKKKVLSKYTNTGSMSIKDCLENSKYYKTIQKLKQTRNAIVHNNTFIDEELKEQVIFGKTTDFAFLTPYLDNINEYIYSVLFTIIYSTQYINTDTNVLDYAKNNIIFKKVKLTKEDIQIIKSLYIS